MSTYSCRWLIMGKNENWHLLLSHCSYFDKVLQKCSLTGPLQNIPFFIVTLLIWLVTMATKRQNLRRNIKKINSSEAVWRIKQKLCRIGVLLTTASTKFFLLPLLKHCGCYGNLKFPLNYNGKRENWDLLLSHCRYFDKSSAEMFVEWSSAKYIILDQICQFDWLPWQPKC